MHRGFSVHGPMLARVIISGITWSEQGERYQRDLFAGDSQARPASPTTDTCVMFKLSGKIFYRVSEISLMDISRGIIRNFRPTRKLLRWIIPRIGNFIFIEAPRASWNSTIRITGLPDYQLGIYYSASWFVNRKTFRKYIRILLGWLNYSLLIHPWFITLWEILPAADLQWALRKTFFSRDINVLLGLNLFKIWI